MAASATQRILNVAQAKFLAGIGPDDALAEALGRVPHAPASARLAEKLWLPHYLRLAKTILQKISPTRLQSQ